MKDNYSHFSYVSAFDQKRKIVSEKNIKRMYIMFSK